MKIEILLCLFLLIISCTQKEKKIELDYCQMIAEDQDDTKDRYEAFIRNYQLLIDYTKQNGFPSIDENYLPQDSCKYQAVTFTLVHIAQTAPELLFNNEIIQLFSKEMKKGNLDVSDLYPAFKISSSQGQAFCEALKPYIDASFKAWQMDEELYERFRYEPCN